MRFFAASKRSGRSYDGATLLESGPEAPRARRCSGSAPKGHGMPRRPRACSSPASPASGPPGRPSRRTAAAWPSQRDHSSLNGEFYLVSGLEAERTPHFRGNRGLALGHEPRHPGIAGPLRVRRTTRGCRAPRVGTAARRSPCAPCRQSAAWIEQPGVKDSLSAAINRKYQHDMELPRRYLSASTPNRGPVHWRSGR
jgi:hypothetical protein